MIALAALSTAAGDDAATCRWCDPGAFDRGAREALAAANPRPPALLSHVLSIGIAPALAFTLTAVPAVRAGRGRYALEDAVIVIDAFVLATALADFTKKTADRERPAFHHGREAATEFAGHPGERNRSFFSGDTAWAFSFVASGTTLARLRGYGTARWIAGAGAAVATGAGLLRIVADVHWATDVMAGAAAGTLVGTGLPLLLHRRAGAPGTAARLVPLPVRGGGGLALAGLL